VHKVNIVHICEAGSNMTDTEPDLLKHMRRAIYGRGRKRNKSMMREGKTKRYTPAGTYVDLGIFPRGAFFCKTK
jgi:hypothetical protein